MSFFGKKEIINDKCIELLFGNTENFNYIFEYIHKNLDDDNFLEINDMSISNFTDTFLKQNHLSFHDIKDNKHILEKFIKQAKKGKKFTLVELANFLGISKSQAGYYYRK